MFPDNGHAGGPTPIPGNMGVPGPWSAGLGFSPPTPPPVEVDEEDVLDVPSLSATPALPGESVQAGLPSNTPSGPAVPEPVLDPRAGGPIIQPPPLPPVEIDEKEVVEAGPSSPGPSPEAAGKGDAAKDAGADSSIPFGFLPLLGWGIGILVAAWMYALAAPFLANAITLHGWRLALSLCMGLLPPAIGVAVVGYAFWRIRRVPRVGQIRESDYGDASSLWERLKTRCLPRLPADIPAIDAYVRENGMECTDAKKLLSHLQGIVPVRWPNSRAKVEEFKRFQALQNSRARDIILRCAKYVGVKTAASPWKIVDVLAVLYHSSRMIWRLSRLYNRQASPRAAFGLACRWFVNLYIAGEAGVVAKEAGIAARSFVSKEFGDSVPDWLPAVLGPLAKYAGKLAEGSLNAFLVWRLGHHAMDSFRFLVTDGE